jgi:hypothetical protein
MLPAMASFVLSPHPQLFPVGTSVGAYPVPGNMVLREQRGADAPATAATESQAVAADGTVSFVALADETLYVAAVLVGEEWRRVQFRTPPSSAQLTARFPSWRARRRLAGLAG